MLSLVCGIARGRYALPYLLSEVAHCLIPARAGCTFARKVYRPNSAVPPKRGGASLPALGTRSRSARRGWRASLLNRSLEGSRVWRLYPAISFMAPTTARTSCQLE
jgi:hypothetical protein